MFHVKHLLDGQRLGPIEGLKDNLLILLINFDPIHLFKD